MAGGKLPIDNPLFFLRCRRSREVFAGISSLTTLLTHFSLRLHLIYCRWSGHPKLGEQILAKPPSPRRAPFFYCSIPQNVLEMPGSIHSQDPQEQDQSMMDAEPEAVDPIMLDEKRIVVVRCKPSCRDQRSMQLLRT